MHHVICILLRAIQPIVQFACHLSRTIIETGIFRTMFNAYPMFLISEIRVLVSYISIGTSRTRTCTEMPEAVPFDFILPPYPRDPVS